MSDDYSTGWNMEEADYLYEDEERTFKQKAKDYFVNDGVKLVFIILYICANLVLFFVSFFSYVYAPASNPAAVEAFSLLGYGVATARGAANALKLNCTFILIPVLRNFLSFLRGTWVNNFLPIDKNLVFHKYIGWLIVFFTLMHTLAHYSNYLKISQITNPALFPTLVARGVRVLPPLQLAWTTLAGATGQIAVICIFLMYSTAMERIRRWYFELFWYTHHLFIIFYAMLLVHGQSNTLEQAQFWMWFLGPATLYLIERLIRIFRGSVQTVVYQAIQHPSNVLEVRLKRTDGKAFRYKSGQYCFLNSPFLAGPEWHPFTITSAPNGDDFISFHIKGVGDWTNGLRSLLNPEGRKGLVCEDMVYAPNGKPILRLDGSFGAASEEVFKFETVMLIGAGIGVTPFGSILKNIHYRMLASDPTYGYDANTEEPLIQKRGGAAGGPSSVRKVHFYWVNRDKESFEWFSDLLSTMERQNVNNFLDINVYLTERVSKADDIKQLMQREEDGEDEVTGLQTRTVYGRPAWDRIFLSMAEQYRGQTVGVFFCGPKVLSKELAKQCRQHTDTRTQTLFKYHKENF